VAGLTSVLTPHPLEAARLLGITTAEIQQDRRGVAVKLAALTASIVVIKGAGSVVAGPDGGWSINHSGGPILAVAGTGDVLAGTIAGLLASSVSQGLKDADSHASLSAELTRLGVWIHGDAGDSLAAQPEWSASIGLPAAQLVQAIRIGLNRLAAGRS
jgi:NAD(P)H-hydrate repair Nnr-like enzyme with NAD(P)H-hydrate dehydratase domain